MMNVVYVGVTIAPVLMNAAYLMATTAHVLMNAAYLMVTTPVVLTVLESQMEAHMKIIVVFVILIALMIVYRAVMEIGEVIL